MKPAYLLQDGAYKFIQTIAGRGEGSTIDRWIRYLLILLGINLAYSLFHLLREIVYMPSFSIDRLIFGMPESLINVVLLPLLGYWLYKRNKRGWIRFREYNGWLHRRADLLTTLISAWKSSL